MRRVLSALLLLAASSGSAKAAPGDDDPKLARAKLAPDRPATTVRAPEDRRDGEDDPKLARGESAAPRPTRRRWPVITHAVPRFELGYRYLSMTGLDGASQPFHSATLGFYPVSNLIRFGLDTEVAFATDTYSMWTLSEGVALGLQWPARVTPFVEGRFFAGLIGATVAGHSGVSYLYGGGIDGGVHVYYAGRFYITASIGWIHPNYNGIDVSALLANPKSIPPTKLFTSDAFTMKVGLGL
jgi:hypothetical protein